MLYMYGMRLRGFSLGCQPKKGFEMVEEHNTNKKYYDVLYYNRELTEQETNSYELDYLGSVEK